MTDEDYAALSSSQPTIFVSSVRDDPNYTKCPRCWHYTHEGLQNYDSLCDRCCRVILECWPDHESWPRIKSNWDAQKVKWSVE